MTESDKDTHYFTGNSSGSRRMERCQWGLFALLGLLCLAVAASLVLAEPWEDLFEEARRLHGQGNHEGAFEAGNRALSVAQKGNHKNVLDVAATLELLASIYEAKGSPDEAEVGLKWALDIRERQFGKNDPKIIPGLERLAKTYRSQGKNEKAREQYERIITIREEAFGREDRHLVADLINVANQQIMGGTQGPETERLLKRAQAIAEKTYGKRHLETIKPLNALAFYYRDHKDWEQAEALFQKILDLRKALEGKDHPNTATALVNLADCNVEQRKYAEAEPLYGEALRIRERSLGPQHFDVANTLDSQAKLFRKLGKEKEAERAILKARRIRSGT